jgi:hypothetical protein
MSDDTFLPDYKNMEMENAQYDLEDFNLSHDTSFETIEEVDDWIEETYTIDNLGIDPYVLMGENAESFANSLQNYGKLNEVLKEFYEHQIFPLWYAHWSAQGIDDTRETVENIYNRLKDASPADLGNLVAMVSMGLNAAHQTGNMIEYFEENVGGYNLKQVLDEIEKGEYVEKANQDLRSIGVQI